MIRPLLRCINMLGNMGTSSYQEQMSRELSVVHASFLDYHNNFLSTEYALKTRFPGFVHEEVMNCELCELVQKHGTFTLMSSQSFL
jgi:hypothetical protein